VFPDFIDCADVGMIERRSGTRLTQKAFEGLPVVRDFTRKKLQGDGAAESSVLGLVDNTHPASAEFLDDPVVRHGLANCG